MIVLDTNVLSEPLRIRPEPNVLRWLTDTSGEHMVTSITVGEILTGVRFLPPGRRRDDLASSIDRVFVDFSERILSYDQAAARDYAELRELRRASGRSLSVEDGMIAAICRTRAASLATRNTRDFDGMGITLINPWVRH
jgi:toxin FitB